MSLLIVFTIISLIIIVEYSSKYDRFLYKCHKLSDQQLEDLGIERIRFDKDKMNKTYVYKYKEIYFKVILQRYSYFNSQVAIKIVKNDDEICDYRYLSKKFKSTFYNQYIEVRYPKTLAKLAVYKSSNNTVKKEYQAFFNAEKLI